MRRLSDPSGQASLELIAVLPLLALVVGALWQAVLAGEAVWSAAGAARAAARARAVGGDPLRAARGAVPGALRFGVRVAAVGEGVAVRVAVPVPGTRSPLGTVEARAALPSQR